MVQNIVRFPAQSDVPGNLRRSTSSMNSVFPVHASSARGRSLQGRVPTTDLAGLFATLARRWPSILALALSGLTLAGLYLVVTPPTYTASTTVFIDPRPKKIVSEDVSQAGLGTDLALLESQVAIIRSDAVLNRVVTTLDLTADPEFAPQPGDGVMATLKAKLGIARQTPDPTTQALVSLAQRLTVKRAQKTYVVDIEASSSSPVKASKITQAIVDAYLADQSTAKAQEAQRANVLIDGRLGELREQVRLSEMRVDEFRRANKILTSEGGTVGEQQLTKLNAELINARSQLAETRARYDEVTAAAKSGNPDAISDPSKLGLVQRLREQAAQVSRREASLASQLLPRHPVLLDIRSQLTELKSQIAAELKRVAATAKAEFQVASSRENELARTLETAKSEVARTNTAQIKQRELEQEVAASRELMRLFLARSKETDEQQKITTPDARIISPPSVPTRASKPIPALILAVGLLGGLAVGLARALMIDHLDQSLRSASDIESRCGLTTLATLPELATPGSGAASVRDWVGRRRQTSTLEASPFKGMIHAIADTSDRAEFNFRQSILRLLSRLKADGDARGTHTILLASPDVNHGTTTTALCLAYAAAMLGDRVLLIDGSSSDPALSNVLAGAMPTDRAIVLDNPVDLRSIATVDPRSGLVFLPIALADLRSLKTSQRLRLIQGLKALSLDFDFVVIDGGAVRMDESAGILLPVAGQVAVVVRANTTALEDLIATAQQLDGGTDDLPGVVLTHAGPTPSRG
jgi:polysaccharide biosynthesis transport protein